jgi:hypothetical protein
MRKSSWGWGSGGRRGRGILLNAADASDKRALRSKEASLKARVEAGIDTKSGRLSKHYRCCHGCDKDR